MTFKVQPLLLNLGTLKGSKIIMRTFRDLRLPCNYELVFMSIPVAVNRLGETVHCLHCVLTLVKLSLHYSCSRGPVSSEERE